MHVYIKTICIARALEKECEELKKIGDVQLLTSLNEVGVALFYHMVNLYSDDAVAYPPLKQLFTTCIETLGNVSSLYNMNKNDIATKFLCPK